MTPVFEQFQFIYPGGALFFDHAGSLCKRLQSIDRALTIKEAERLQIALHDPSAGIDLAFGIRASTIQVLRNPALEFAQIAKEFLSMTAATFELTDLSEFSYELVLGRECSDRAEAQALMLPLIPEESRMKLEKLASSGAWRAIQTEYERDGFEILHRFGVLDLTPEVGVRADSVSPRTTPHITVRSNVRCLNPTKIEGLDIEVFIRSMRAGLTEDLLTKLAPHLK
ncbi:MAG: hypothetical protein JNL10_09975 [Verrucomicrobiales bacterium]|nr:hypothetical protein [Verrucomicrobiales bacterium]